MDKVIKIPAKHNAYMLINYTNYVVFNLTKMVV